jgi:hypothetical protein
LNWPGLTRTICVSFALTKIRCNLFELFQRRFQVFACDFEFYGSVPYRSAPCPLQHHWR